MLKESMRRGMPPGILKQSGSLAGPSDTLTARSSTNRNSSSVPGSRPLDGIAGKATNGIDSSAGSEQPEGILSSRPLAGNGATTAASAQMGGASYRLDRK
jgi:hypothetical protein